MLSNVAEQREINANAGGLYDMYDSLYPDWPRLIHVYDPHAGEWKFFAHR